MNNQELERKLADAVSHAAPNDVQDVLSRCDTRKGNVIPMTPRKKPHTVRNLIAACLALLLVGGAGGLFYRDSYAVASVVSLDVNPSIELNINRQERVISCTPLNEDARTVLADMAGGADLKGTKLEVAVNAIVGALVQNGYLDSISSAILISVEDGDPARASRLRQELTGCVDTLLQSRTSEAAVYSQTVAKDATLEQQAKAHNISTGKAALVNQAIALNSSLQFDALASLSVEELRQLVRTGASQMPIGADAALRAAAAYAQLPDNTYISREVDPELDENPPHYEVELEGSFGEAEFKVNAYTGEVFYGPSDLSIAPIAPGTTTDPTPSTNPTPSVPPSPAVTPSPSPAPSASGTDDIGADAAKAAALAHAGLTEDQVTRLRVERDRDDGRLEYDVEFRANGMEYEYTIHAATGAVLEHEKDRDD